MKRRLFCRTVAFCGVLALMLAGCAVAEVIPIRRDPPVALRDLMIDLSVFPAGWRMDEISSIPRGASDDIGEESLMIVCSIRTSPEWQDAAYHLIYRFRNPTLADRLYERMQGDILYFRETHDSRKHPVDWQYRSPIADDWRFACEFGRCGVIARYDEFVSVFSASMTTPAMTPAALEAALRAIDQRMAEKLGKQPTTSTERSK